MLCDRLGIFVDGQLVCLGTPKDLTSRFGGYYVSRHTLHEVVGAQLGAHMNPRGWSAWQLPGGPGPPFPGSLQVFTIMTPAEQGEAAHSLVLTMSPGARQTYSLSGTRKYELPVSEVTLAGVFETMTAASAHLTILDWGIANATLEEVFIKVGWGGKVWRGEQGRRRWCSSCHACAKAETSNLVCFLLTFTARKTSWCRGRQLTFSEHVPRDESLVTRAKHFSFSQVLD